MSHPTVFISHRHADAKVARIVADFLKRNSAGNVCVQLSSSADYGHPGVGERLVPTLKRHLAVSDVVVLIFTAEGPGWSWCMWECGVATDPHDDTSTKVVVLQCGDDVPAPYADQLRIDVRELEPLTGFVKQVLATNDLFPHHDRADQRLRGGRPGAPRAGHHAARRPGRRHRRAAGARGRRAVGVDVRVHRARQAHGRRLGDGRAGCRGAPDRRARPDHREAGRQRALRPPRLHR